MDAPMSHRDPSGRPASRRSPALTAAVALAGGILLDRHAALPVPVWIGVGAVVVLMAVLAARRGPARWAVTAALVGLVALGAARHHRAWSVRAADDIARFARGEPQLVRLDGELLDRPVVRPPRESSAPTAFPQIDQTVLLVECRRLYTTAGPLPVSGRIQVWVAGHTARVTAGDSVRLTGWMIRPAAPANPGAFNYADYLRAQGIGCTLRISHPDAVQPLASPEGFDLQRWWRRLLADCRGRAERILIDALDPRISPVAVTLLIGQWSQLPQEVRDAFAVTGMIHVLAISGMHAAIFAGFVWMFCRLAQLSPRSTALVVLLAVWGLAVLSGLRPPIVRAALFLTVAMLGRLTYRPSQSVNTVAVTAAVLLLADPLALFDVGAQLSFLSVVGLMWGMRRARPRDDADRFTPDLFPDESVQPTPIRDLLRFCGRSTRAAAWVMLAVWILTAPLIAYQFGIVSPISLPLNLLLLPWMALLLGAGYATLLAGLTAPALVPIVAAAFGALLWLLVWSVEAAAAVHLGHLNIPQVPTWWLLGYYAILFAALFAALGARPVRWRRVLAPGCAAWVLLGLAVGLHTPRQDALRCTFLSVGHGVAVLVETPDGGTLLYDAGSIDDPERACRTVVTALHERGRVGLNGLILSHADIDHFNAAALVLKEVPSAGVYVAPSFLDFGQDSVRQTCDAVAAAGVPMRTVGAGDRLRLDDAVTMTVLAPQPRQREANDNANSIVLRIEYAGRAVLLTGDLEGDGLAALVDGPAEGRCDVLMVPHHGSLQVDHIALAAWSRPQLAVISAARPDLPERLQLFYGPGCELLSTADDGAVVIEITADGHLTRSTHRPR
jgi:competence protein ComEC